MSDIDYPGVECLNATDEHIEYIVALLKNTRFGESESLLISAIYISISVVGLISNGLVCLIVVGMRKMRTSANILIGNMSFANFLFSAILVPFIWLPSLNGSWDFGNFWCKQISVIAGVNVFCSTFTIIALAADRYYTVTFTGATAPLRQLRSLVVVGSIWLSAAVLSVPYWVYYGVESKNLEEFCRPNVTFSTTCEFLIPQQLGYVVSGLQLLFLLPVPLVFLAIFNCRLSQYLAASQSSNLTIRNSRGSSLARRKVPFLLFAMTASYAVLWMPFLLFVAIGDMAAQIVFDFDQTGDTFRRIEAGLHLLSSASVCANPLLYGFFNSHFKRAFRDIWWRLKAAVGREVLLDRSDFSLSIRSHLQLYPKRTNCRPIRFSSIVQMDKHKEGDNCDSASVQL